MTKPPLDLDALIARVRAQAEQDDAGLDAPGRTHDPDAAPRSPARAATAAGRSGLRVAPMGTAAEDTVTLDGLLCYRGERFLRHAYLAVLGRDIDAEGLAIYRDVVSEPGGRCWVIANLLWSAEGRARGAALPGLEWVGFVRPLPAKRIWRSVLKRVERRRSRRPEVLVASAMERFAERIDGIDARLRGVADEAQRTAEDLRAGHARLARDFDCSRADIVSHRARMQELMQRLAGLAPAAAPAAAPSAAGTDNGLTQIVTDHAGDMMDAFYIAFEDAFRGDRADIRDSLRHYLADLRTAGTVSSGTPLLDVGCGRGEWLELLRDEGLAAEGVDLNRVAVEQCRAIGLAAVHDDAIEALSRRGDASLGAISAFHIIEHLPFERLLALLQQSFRVLVPGGVLLLETPNPENVLVGSHTFYHDPTHRNPLTPTSTRFFVRYCGFTEPEIRRLHPYPESARVAGDDALTERVNGHLCGPQDFAVIAHRPPPPA